MTSSAVQEANRHMISVDGEPLLTASFETTDAAADLVVAMVDRLTTLCQMHNSAQSGDAPHADVTGEACRLASMLAEQASAIQTCELLGAAEAIARFDMPVDIDASWQLAKASESC